MNRECQMENAYKFGAGRYRQESGCICLAGQEALHRKCRTAFIIAGRTAFHLAGAELISSLNACGVEHIEFLYSGYCTVTQANTCADMVKNNLCDLVIGMGGGRIMDLAKVTARICDVPVFTVPTLSATTAPFTHMAVMYQSDGSWDGTWYLPNEVSCVLVDMTFLEKQPYRYAASGIMDAMAKYVEICHPANGLPDGLQGDTRLAKTIAKHVFDRLVYLAPYLHETNEQNPNMWEICFLSIAGGAMVSGTARCKQQSALAHAFYEWTKRFHIKAVTNALHGEIVGVGLRMQAVFNQDAECARLIDQTLKTLHMPATLRDIGLNNGEAVIEEISSWLMENTALVSAEQKELLKASVRTMTAKPSIDS